MAHHASELHHRMRTTWSLRRQLRIFFLLAFGISWLTWIPAFTIPQFPRPVVFIGLFAPALAALIVASLASGLEGIRELVGRYRIWQFSVGWYGLAILLIPLIFIVAGTLTRSTPTLWRSNSWYFNLASFALLTVMNSGEEIGWRGFALPRLLALKRSPLWTSLLLGAIWGVWHLPTYLIPGQSSFPLPLFLLLLCGLSLIYTSLFVKTGGSLIAAVLLHASTDIAPRLLDITQFSVVTWGCIVALVWLSGVLLWYLARPHPHTTDERVDGLTR